MCLSIYNSCMEVMNQHSPRTNENELYLAAHICSQMNVGAAPYCILDTNGEIIFAHQSLPDKELSLSLFQWISLVIGYQVLGFDRYIQWLTIRVTLHRKMEYVLPKNIAEKDFSSAYLKALHRYKMSFLYIWIAVMPLGFVLDVSTSFATPPGTETFLVLACATVL